MRDTILVLGNGNADFGRRRLDIQLGHLLPDIGLGDRLRQQRALRRGVGNRDPGLQFAAKLDRYSQTDRHIGAADAVIRSGADEILDLGGDRGVRPQRRDRAPRPRGIDAGLRRLGRRGAAARRRYRVLKA